MLWPLVIAALIASLVAIARRSWRIALLAAGLYLPFALYLAANPGGRWLGPVAWLAYLAAAYALRRGSRLGSAALSLPAAAVAAYVGWLVVTQ